MTVDPRKRPRLKRPLMVDSNRMLNLFRSRLAFRFNRRFLALEVSHPAFAFDGFVGLLSHISLYFRIVFRFCVVTMVSRSSRFNLYLLLPLLLVALAGCQSPEAKRQRQLATARVYLEVGRARPGQTQQVGVLRAAPMLLNIESDPFLNEIHVAAAEIVDTPGGWVLTIRLNHKGALLLEQFTANHHNRRMAIRCQWGVAPNVQDRWVAAPLITKRISDGALTFTPDASREEVDEIVIGLNNYANNGWIKDKPYTPQQTGGVK